MILSSTELHKALDQGRLVIEPEPSPRLPTIGGPHCPYDTHSVDLRLSPASEKPSRVLPQPTGTASASNREARASKTACSASSMLATATSMAAAAYSSARSARFSSFLVSCSAFH